MNVYQKSLIEESSRRTLKQTVRRWVNILFVSLLATGLLLRSIEYLPSFFDGWLIFCTALYIAFNWFGAFSATMMCGIMLIMKFIIEKTKDSPSWEKETEKLQYKTRSLIVYMSKQSRLLSAFNWSVGSIVDVVTDWILFTILVTINHPYVALFHGTSLVFQYLAIQFSKKTLRAVIEFLPDPLEESHKTNIDDLMDKLCDPKKE